MAKQCHCLRKSAASVENMASNTFLLLIILIILIMVDQSFSVTTTTKPTQADGCPVILIHGGHTSYLAFFFNIQMLRVEILCKFATKANPGGWLSRDLNPWWGQNIVIFLLIVDICSISCSIFHLPLHQYIRSASRSSYFIICYIHLISFSYLVITPASRRVAVEKSKPVDVPS